MSRNKKGDGVGKRRVWGKGVTGGGWGKVSGESISYEMEVDEVAGKSKQIKDRAKGVWKIMKNAVSISSSLNHSLHNTSLLIYLLEMKNELED